MANNYYSSRTPSAMQSYDGTLEELISGQEVRGFSGNAADFRFNQNRLDNEWQAEWERLTGGSSQAPSRFLKKFYQNGSLVKNPLNNAALEYKGFINSQNSQNKLKAQQTYNQGSQRRRINQGIQSPFESPSGPSSMRPGPAMQNPFQF